MPNGLFAELEDALIRGGAAPRYVQRTLLELREHFEDLASDARAAGLPSDEAARRARAQLGSEQTIAAVILAHPELRAWSRRWPRAASCLKAAVFVATLPEAPALLFVDYRTAIARWSAAVGGAAVLVGSLLAGLNFLIVVG